MDRERVVIVGAGGHGRELFSLLVDANKSDGYRRDVLGFVDDGEPDTRVLDRLDASLLGAVREVLQLDAKYLLGIGDSSLREKLDRELAAVGAVAASPAIHPGAWIGPDVTLGPGSVICAGASITTNVRVGRHVHLNRGATVGHDCTLEDYVTIAPMSAVSGNVVIEQGAELGTGVTVLPGCRIGTKAIVGAQALVTRNVPSGTTVIGIPARSK